MSYFFIIVLLLAVLNSSCTNSGVLLQPGGALSPAEQRNIVAIHQNFAHWIPSQSALWVRHGIVRHICLQGCGVASITEPYLVFVFDGDGRVVEANYIQAPNPSTPKMVSSVSPLQVTYECLNGITMTVGVEYSQEVERHEIQKQMDLQNRVEAIFESWKRSGSTNQADLFHMIDNTITNSQR